MRRGFWIFFWSVLGTIVWRGALIPAPIRNLRMSKLGQQEAWLEWGYGAGVRPQSIIFDLEVAGVIGSATTTGESTTTTILLDKPISGSYRINTTATYRILGMVYRTHSQGNTE